LTPIVAGVGGVIFLLAALFIVRDRRNAEADIEGRGRRPERSICVLMHDSFSDEPRGCLPNG
jgi:hypothetical protein